MFPLSDDAKKQVEKQSSLFYKIMKNSLNIKEENVLLISDYGIQNNNLATMLGYGYYHTATKKGFKTNILFQDVKKGFMKAESHVIKTLQDLPKKSVIIVTASHKLGRIGQIKSFRTFCKEQGHRFISATGLGDVKSVHFDLFLEAMSVNQRRMKKQGLAIKKLWDKANEITVKTDAGTDLTFDVSGMEAIANLGEYHEPGTGGNIPAGEVYIPPRGFIGVKGVLVIDGSLKTEQGAILLDEPVTVFIEEGRVVRMEGKHAHLLEQTFQKFEDRSKYPERVRLVCELGIGINPSAVLIGSTIMDEKVLGTGHVAMGSNYWFGGPIKTLFHGDMVFKSPRIYVDGKRMEM